MKEYRLTILLGATACLLPASLGAAWSAVDTFENGNLDGWNIMFTQSTFDPEAPPHITVTSDPLDSSNNVMEVYPGRLVSGTVNTDIWRHLGAENVIYYNPGVKATLYWREMRPTVVIEGQPVPARVDFVAGLTIQGFNPETGAPVQPQGYGAFSVLTRIFNDHGFDVYEKDLVNAEGAPAPGYVSVPPTEGFTLNADTWFEFWVVIDHVTNHYEVYIKGGSQFPAQTKIYPIEGGLNGTGDPALYRNETFDDLVSFYIRTSTGSVSGGLSGRDPSYVDDIYVDIAGENLSSPAGGGETWAGYPLNNGWADTGAWLGALYPDKSGDAWSGWVWSHSLQTWIYLDEASAAAGAGAWVWVMK